MGEWASGGSVSGTAPAVGSELGVAAEARAESGWRDPARLAQMLARYRFVANLISPRHDVAEYGCAESLGTAMVLQRVKKIALYSPDPRALADLHRNFPADWPFEAQVHDILSGPLPKKHDS